MPVLDWSRTTLKVETKDGTITTKFGTGVFAAFDIYILKRPVADRDYSSEILHEAEIRCKNMEEQEKEELTRTILFGLPGSLETLPFENFRNAVLEYTALER